MRIQIALLLCFISFVGFGQNDISGLWLVDQVSVGEETMTPVGKWTRFNADGTQSSGNGWKQHTIGEWKLEGDQLELTSHNAPEDEAGAFTVLWISDEELQWTRVEMGDTVVVRLSRIDELPTTDADRLIGEWEVVSAPDSSEFYEGIIVFIRWDNILKITVDGTDYYGIYRIHGHRNSIEWIPYSVELVKANWSFQFDQEGKLILLDQDEPIASLKRTSESQ